MPNGDGCPQRVLADRNSVASNEISNSVISTGNYSPILLGHGRMQDALIQPEEVYRRVQIDGFVGRKWLIDEIDAILEKNSCGYIVLEADAGLGKTAFLAWLAKQRNYINHFVELAPGKDGVERGLKNLAAQLISKYELMKDEWRPDAATRPDYLYGLLSRAAEKRHQDEKVIVVVDALDEAGTPPDQNVLGLPKALPDGVFLIVSMRPVRVSLQVDRSITSFSTLRIIADSHENLGDMRSFLEEVAIRPEVSGTLQESGYSAREFIDVLMKKCQGLWIYLHFLVPEIERGDRSPLDLEKLPNGLNDYYASYWNRWREKDDWYGTYLPILSAIAAMQESSTLDRLLEFAGIKASIEKKSELTRILKENWRSFLFLQTEVQLEKYRFYHATIMEFFNGKAERESLLEHQKVLVDELAKATGDVHKNIAERYLAAWGGLENCLPDLISKWDLDEGYGFRHIATHLEASNEAEKLHRLLGLETPQRENLWYKAKEMSGDLSGYINDVMTAWQLAEKSSRFSIDNGQRTHKIALEIRYALITASINSISANIPKTLFIQLVKNGLWNDSQSLAYVRHIPDLSARATNLSFLSLEFKKINNIQALKTTLESAKEIENNDERSRAIATIAYQLLDPADAFDMIEDLSHDWAKAWLLIMIAPKLTGPQLDEAIKLIRGIKDDSYRARALAPMAKNFSPPVREQVLEEALVSARKIKSVYARSMLLVDIANFFPDSIKSKILDEALEMATKSIEYDEPLFFRPQALSKVLLSLKDAERALSLTKKITNLGIRTKTIARIGLKFSEPKKTEILKEVLILISEFGGDSEMSSVLPDIAPQIPGHLLDEAFSLIHKISEEDRTKALIRFFPHLSEPLLKEALNLIEEIEDENCKAEALAEIAHNLPENKKIEALEKALVLAKKIHDEYGRSLALISVASYLCESEKIKYLTKSLELIKKIRVPFEKSEALVRIAFDLPDDLLKETLELARESTFLKSVTLAKISPILPQCDRMQALEEVLSSVKIEEEEFLKIHELIEIAPYLPESLLKEALRITKDIEDERPVAKIAQNLGDYEEAYAMINELKNKALRFMALVDFSHISPEPKKSKIINQAVELLKEIEFNYDEMMLLPEIASKLPDPWRTKILDSVLNWALELGSEVEFDKSRVLADVASYCTNLDTAITIAQKISYKSERCKAFAEIALNLPEPRRTKYLKDALFSAGEIDNYSRSAVLNKISVHLSGMSLAILYPLWRDTLRILAQNPRQELLLDIASMISIINALGDSNVMQDIADIFEKIGYWWP